MLLAFLLVFLAASPPSHGLNQDGRHLLAAKAGLADPDATLASWNTRDNDPCRWAGVRCHPTTRRVISLTIANSTVSGLFPASLCRLPSLASLSLPNNSINDSLAHVDFSACRSLRRLDLSENLLVGQLPPSLPDIPNLQYLNLSGNNFSGEIPASFGRFQRLQELIVWENLLNGSFPSFLANITSLKRLHLAFNPFATGRLSPDLSNLTDLEDLWLTGCNLIGQIPESLARLKKLKNFDLSGNMLTGAVPGWLPELTGVVQVELYNNQLSGELPPKMSNMAALLRIDVSGNDLEGTIPDDLCGSSLQSLSLYNNRFVGPLPECTARSPNLSTLVVFGNRLNGSLPGELGTKTPLATLDVSANNFSGHIPANLCSKGELVVLNMFGNSFSGKIPQELGNCKSLKRLRLQNNRLSGEVPPELWGLPRLYLLELNENSLSGHISHMISGAQSMATLLISKNHFGGPLPDEIALLKNLHSFSGDGNDLTGEIPRSLAKLTELGQVDLSNNNLSGEIPKGVQSWKKLNELRLANNRLSGEIPRELGGFPVLNYLDLSGNRLSGEIPRELQNLKLNLLNLSNNRLSGGIPPLYDKPMFRNSFVGNPGLCGKDRDLCSPNATRKNRRYLWIMLLVFVLAAVVLVVGVVWFYFKYQKIKTAKELGMRSKWRSFHKLDFDQLEIFGCLREDNVIGAGSSGKVYRVVLSNGEAVAVKKLPGRSKEGTGGLNLGKDAFEVEAETLGKIRHKNIVRLWCCCKVRDCKLLVYEYMPCGSLGDVLHGGKGGVLDWPTRLRIALDAAVGLSYLHHDTVPPVIHRDVKSNNILLDAEFHARIADFGVAKFVHGVESMSEIAGSCGYIAPEYGYTLRVSEKSDVYSFGVVILEVVTGRMPVDPELGGKDMVKWVTATLEEKGVESLVDPKLDPVHKEEICRVLNVGLCCTSSLPLNRPTMRWVVKMLQAAAAAAEDRLGPADHDGKRFNESCL